MDSYSRNCGFKGNTRSLVVTAKFLSPSSFSLLWNIFPLQSRRDSDGAVKQKHWGGGKSIYWGACYRHITHQRDILSENNNCFNSWAWKFTLSSFFQQCLTANMSPSTSRGARTGRGVHALSVHKTFDTCARHDSYGEVWRLLWSLPAAYCKSSQS